MNRGLLDSFASLRVIRGRVLCILSGLSLSFSANAAPPTLEHIFPAGGQQGSTVSVSAGGKHDPWPVHAWTDAPGVEFKADDAKGKFTVRIPQDTPAGPYLVRLYNKDGASELRTFVVGRLAELTEKEPNDNARQPQKLDQLPAVVNGRLDKSGDTDSFSFELNAGQWLVASVASYSIGSPVDPILHLLDADGNKVAFNHDSHNLDPLVAYQAKKTGTHVLQLAGFVHPPAADVRFTGSAATVYRLTLTAGPYVRYAFPPGAQRGVKVPARLSGWNLGQARDSIEFLLDASDVQAPVDFKDVLLLDTANYLRLPVGDFPEQVEAEPNNSIAEAREIPVPGIVNGRIHPAGDTDRFAFTARKNEKYEIRVISSALGFPLDAVLRIEDKAGKQLARDDDGGGGGDAKLTWTAPADDTYFVAVSDLMNRGSEDFIYRLEMSPALPDFRATATGHAFKIEPGKTAEVKINVTLLHGYQGELKVVAEGLPEGVGIKEAKVPAKGGETKVILEASAEATPSSQPFRLLVAPATAETPKPRPAIFDIKAGNVGGDLLINQTDQLWLTVLPKTEKTEKKGD